MDISKIDVNFSLGSAAETDDLNYYNFTEKPFKLWGLFEENGVFRRVPYEIANSVSKEFEFLSCNAAGGRVTFETDSDKVAIIAKMSKVTKMSHCTFLGSCGFDLYADNEYYRAFVPPYEIANGYMSSISFPDKRPRKIIINLPLYSEVKDLNIGLNKEAFVKEYNPYKNISPIVYYGSSITQGACACKPGNAYQFPISKKHGVDFINLGFSGNAKGETVIAEYISKLDMSIFVLDYDHNADTPEDLRNTHQNFYNIIRKANKDLPIIIISRPDYHFSDTDKQRKEIIYKTYTEAKSNGDNVYFIDGESFYEGYDRGLCTVDSTHPNDLGMYLMAQKIDKVISEILK